MEKVSLHLDLDETLIHSIASQVLFSDLKRIFPDGDNLDTRCLRNRFDHLVDEQMPKVAMDPALRFQRKLEVEQEIALELLARKGWLRIQSRIPILKNRLVCIRPGLGEFLQQLSGLGNIYLCTSAGREYAEACLFTANVSQWFKAIHTLEDIAASRLVPVMPAPLLVDNLPVNDVMVLRKLRFLGVPISFDYELAAQKQLMRGEDPEIDRDLVSRHHMMISEYCGQARDQGLSQALPEIIRKVVELRKRF